MRLQNIAVVSVIIYIYDIVNIGIILTLVLIYYFIRIISSLKLIYYFIIEARD